MIIIIKYFQGKTWVKKVDEKNPVVNCRYIQPPIDPETGNIDDTKGEFFHES